MAEGNDVLGSLLIEIGIEAPNFNGQMSEIGRRMGMAKAEFMAAGGAVKGFDKSSEGAAARAKMLSDQLELQRAKAGLLEKRYDAVSQEMGANSKEAQELKMRLDGTRGEMARLENELKDTASATERAADKTNKLGDEQVKTEKKTKDFSGAMDAMKGMVGAAASGLAAAAAAVAAAGAAAVTAAVGMGKAAMESADEIQKMADVTGRTAEELQIMQYQGNNLGVELGTMEGAQAKLTRSMDSARDQLLKYHQGMAEHQKDNKKAIPVLGDAAKAYQTLGVRVTDGKGKLRDSAAVMNEAITALGSIKNETERDALAMALFGKSAMELNPLIKAGGAELARLADEAKKTGAIMSNETVAGLDSFGDSIDSLQQSVTGIAGTMLNSLMPTLNPIIDGFKGLTGAAAEATKTGDWSGFATQAAGMLQQVVGTITSMLPTFIQVGTQILTTLIGSIASSVPVVIPQLVTAMVTLINAITGIMATNGPMIVTAAVNAVGTLIRGLLSALPQLMQAAIQIVLALVQGVAAQLPTLIPAAVQCIVTLVQGLISSIPDIVTAAIQLVTGLADGILQAIPIFVEAAPQVIDSFITAAITNLPKLIEAGSKVILGLVNGILTNLPALYTGYTQMISQLLPTVMRMIPQIMQTALVLVQGLINGIVTNLPLIINAALELMNTLLTALISNLPMLLNGALQLVIGLVTGIINALPNIIDAALNLVQGLVTGLIQNLPMIIEAAINLVLNLAVGLVQAIPKLITAAIQLVTGLIEFIINNIPMIIQMGIDIVIALAKGLIEAIPELVKAIPDIITALVNGVASMATKIWDIGKNIVTGIWDGISKAAEWLWKKIEEWVGGLVQGIKDFLGIKSPSRVFSGIGTNISAGLAQGILGSVGMVRNAMDALTGATSMGGLNVAMSPLLAGGPVSGPVGGYGSYRAGDNYQASLVVDMRTDSGMRQMSLDPAALLPLWRALKQAEYIENGRSVRSQ